MKKKVLLAFAVLAAIGIGWLMLSKDAESALPAEATKAVRNKMPAKQSAAKAVQKGQVPAKAVVSKKALKESPKPSKPAGGEIIAYRSAVLPPQKKGQTVGELREWLIRPKEGYAIHLEEHWRPDSKGEMALCERREYAANQY